MFRTWTMALQMPCVNGFTRGALGLGCTTRWRGPLASVGFVQPSSAGGAGIAPRHLTHPSTDQSGSLANAPARGSGFLASGRPPAATLANAMPAAAMAVTLNKSQTRVRLTPEHDTWLRPK